MTDTHVSPDYLIADAFTPADVPDLVSVMHEDDPGEPWQIDGRREAEWALAKIRAAHQDYADATAPAREQIDVLQARIDELAEFIDREGERRDHTVSFFTGHLTGWLRRLRRKDLDNGIDPDKATKSVKLAGGTVASRAGHDRVRVDQPDVVAVWSEETFEVPDDRAPGRWEAKVDQHKLRAFIKATGEVPPGITYQPATEDDRIYSVKVG